RAIKLISSKIAEAIVEVKPPQEEAEVEEEAAEIEAEEVAEEAEEGPAAEDELEEEIFIDAEGPVGPVGRVEPLAEEDEDYSPDLEDLAEEEE
ncbi:MAG: hypothetical protein ACPL7K_09845, partial [Armatimonadota bacterium]